MARRYVGFFKLSKYFHFHRLETCSQLKIHLTGQRKYVIINRHIIIYFVCWLKQISAVG